MSSLSRSKSRVPVTLGVKKTPDGPVRASAAAPLCSECGTNEHVVRIWHGQHKVWACSVHFKIKSTRRKEATLKQRLLHRLPDADEFELREVLPNRRMRRRRTR